MFDTPAEAFNCLSQIPEACIELGDGRILEVAEWFPEGLLQHLEDERVPVTIKGFIVLKREA